MWTLLVHLDRVQVLRGAWGIVLSWLFSLLGCLRLKCGKVVGIFWKKNEVREGKLLEIIDVFQ